MRRETSKDKTGLTPFISGINDAGSVDIEASSMKTRGKSVTRSRSVAAVIQVVQT